MASTIFPRTVDGFAARHIGTDESDQRIMLAALGYESVSDLLDAALPRSIRVSQGDGLQGCGSGPGASVIPGPASERAALAELRDIAAENTVLTPMIGLGYYGTATPAVITRNLLENPAWYTAYTPYQPEISQGRLEGLLNFQTMIADLTGLATANASMLDEATAAVEAMLLARRVGAGSSNRFLVDADTLPQTIAVLATRAEAVGIELDIIDFAELVPDRIALGDYFGLLLQYPGASGRVWNPAEILRVARESGATTVVAADLLALTLLTSPGELGADIAVGTSQRFGVPMGWGGPHAGYLAVRAGLERQLPGRLVGVSRDAAGKSAYRLSLQTREQHIRRERATSNICTAQVLLAVMAAMYAVYHGPDGLRRIAHRVHARARALATVLTEHGMTVQHGSFFDTIRVRTADPGAVLERAHDRGYQLYLAPDGQIGVAVDETTTIADLAAVAEAFGVTGAFGVTEAVGVAEAFGVVGRCSDEPAELSCDPPAFPAELRRESDYLTHPVFNTYRSETAMMRYLKMLADKDYALDRGMIPLGSCTMKLNAATEMAAVTWPEFANLHPFAPASDAAGYRVLTRQLSEWLAELTGYDTVSLQPNAGSQGELAGLLAIRGYHRARGEENRTVCLIPSSAHGTNAASAVLAGMRVVVVACDERGNVDLEGLRGKIEGHADELAAIMLTYPSTHGVYEHEVMAITAAVHAAGGQVYIDGANLNALLGQATFGDIGGDVSHLNLHKTFCIPHGGGGPGVGPVAAKNHLAPYLPGHPFDPAGLFQGAPVSAAPNGSAGILPISWAYVRMMGVSGMREATAAAVLAANYVAVRLREHYPVLYTGDHGLVAHECILDLRPLTAATGVTVEDVAKRLIDYGFHAPTMSFPVAGTLMVEPTESEDLAEIDRFIAAMIAIKAEADTVGRGEWPVDDNPLRNAPHIAEQIAAAEWAHPYSRELAVFPSGESAAKYWPPVQRIDQAYGDRHLVCACPPMAAYQQS